MQFYLIALGAYLFPFMLNWRQIGSGDWDQSISWAQIAVWWHQRGAYSVTWNPFLCGGYPLFGNPQIPIYHPSLPLLWIFGPVVGVKVAILLWMSLGFYSFSRLMKHLGFEARSSSLFSLLWVLNGFFVAHLGQLHFHYICFFLVPAFFLIVRLWIETKQLRYLVLFVALVLFSSLNSYSFLAYFLPFIPVYLLLELYFRKIEWRNFFRITAPFILSLAFAVALMAFYLIPVARYLREFPRTTPLYFENPLELVTYLFFPGKLFKGKTFGWEYQIFIGPVLFYFLILGLKKLKQLPVSVRPLLALATLSCLLAMGSFRDVGSPLPSLLDLARDFVPGFSNIRTSSRFLILALPAILVVAGWQWDLRGISRQSLFWVLTPLVLFHWNNSFQLVFREPSLGLKKPPPTISNDFHWVQQARIIDTYNHLDSTTGVWNCYDSTPVPREGLPPFEPALISKIP